MTSPPPLPAPEPRSPKPEPDDGKPIIATALILAMPVIVGVIQKATWTSPRGAYSGMGAMMMLPFLMLVAGGLVAMVSIATVLLIRWAKIGTKGAAFLLLYALCGSGLAWLAAIY